MRQAQTLRLLQVRFLCGAPSFAGLAVWLIALLLQRRQAEFDSLARYQYRGYSGRAASYQKDSGKVPTCAPDNFYRPFV